jgi:hypothetical protein
VLGGEVMRVLGEATVVVGIVVKIMDVVMEVDITII